MRLIIPPLILSLTLAMGCHSATTTTPPAALVPGAINSFDQASYTSLVTAQASYNSLLASYKANPTTLAALKAPLDAAAQAINLAEIAYSTYHAAAAAAGATPAQISAVITSLANAQTAISQVKP